MIPIITEITFYIVLALLLGYLFGWLTTKAFIEERLEKELQSSTSKELDRIKQELNKYTIDNEILLSENNQILRQNSEKKLQLHELKKRLEKLNLLVKNKNSMIEQLQSELSKEKNLILELQEEKKLLLAEGSKLTNKYMTLLEQNQNSDS
jgi:chromosome segregation ATPase